jgi:hypothetical protein
VAVISVTQPAEPKVSEALAGREEFFLVMLSAQAKQ